MSRSWHTENLHRISVCHLGTQTNRRCRHQEISNRVGEDGFGVKFPIFQGFCSRLPSSTKKNKDKFRITERNKKSKKNGKKGKIRSNPGGPHLYQPMWKFPQIMGLIGYPSSKFCIVFQISP